MATVPKMKAKYGSFYEKLHKTSKNLSVQSLYVYLRNISRLRGLLHETEELPNNGKWLLDKKLLAKFDTLDLNKRRLMSVAAVKALKAYKVTSEEWNKRLARASDSYDKQRKKRTRENRTKEQVEKERKAAKQRMKRTRENQTKVQIENENMERRKKAAKRSKEQVEKE